MNGCTALGVLFLGVLLVMGALVWRLVVIGFVVELRKEVEDEPNTNH